MRSIHIKEHDTTTTKEETTSKHNIGKPSNYYDERKKKNSTVQTMDYIYMKLKSQQTNLYDRIQKTYLWEMEHQPEHFLGG